MTASDNGLDLDAATLPDAWSVLLPSRAYLISAREQTLPARQAALDDANAHFDEAAASGDADRRDMALLGLVGDAMQILEDVGYFGTAYGSPLGGMPHYVTATIFNDRTPNNFYSQIKKRTDEQLKVLAGLWLRDPNTGAQFPIHEAFKLEGQLDDDDLAALMEAENATVKLLRPYLLALAHAWAQFRRYFHAFKHGALVISRDDFSVVDAGGSQQSASLQVWLRRGGDGTGWGDTALTPQQVRNEVRRTGQLALDVFAYLIDSRLVSLDLVEFDDDGQILQLLQPRSLWQFWFHEADVSSSARHRLGERFGIEFVEYRARDLLSGARTRSRTVR